MKKILAILSFAILVTGCGIQSLPLPHRYGVSNNCPDGSVGPVCNNVSGPTMISQINNAFNGITPISPSVTNLTAGPGAISIIGNQTNGADQVNHVNINSQVNPQTYGAVASTTTTTCTMSSSSHVATLGAAGDFANGQAIGCAHAGTNPNLSTPTITVVSDKWTTNAFYVPTADGSSNNAACYEVVATDGNGGKSAPSTKTCITNSVAQPTFDAFNNITLGGHISGATAYEIYGCLAANPATTCTVAGGSLIAVIPDISGTTPFWYDWGNACGNPTGSCYYGHDVADGSSPNSGQLSDNLLSTISSGAGTTSVTLAAAASTATSATLFGHNNAAAFASAIAATCVSGAIVTPNGNYDLWQPLIFLNCTGTTLTGAAISPSGTTFRNMVVGMQGIYEDSSREMLLQNFELLSAAGGGSTWGAAFDLDNASPSGSTVSTHNIHRNVQIDEAGIKIRLSNTANTNNDTMTFDGIEAFNGGFASIWSNNANDLQYQFRHFSTGQENFGVYLLSGLGASLFDTVNFAANALGFYRGATGDPITFTSWGCESCRRLEVTTQSSGNAVDTWVGGRANPTVVSTDNHYIGFWERGTLNLIANDFSSASSASNFDIFLNGSGANLGANIIGNQWPTSSTPFDNFPYSGGSAAGATGLHASGNKFYGPGASLADINTDTITQVIAKNVTGSATASVSGGGSLSTGSNSFTGRITGLAASSNILTPGFTCTNAVSCTFQDDTTVGGVKVTAQSTTTETFSATASDTADYICGCR